MGEAYRVHVALPAYNEEANLPTLLDRWRAVLAGLPVAGRMLVVDDGSSDGTPAVLAKRALAGELAVHTHVQNQGLGRTIADALRLAAQDADPQDVIVTMDADNSHPPELLPRMLAVLAERGVDVVVASRYEPGAQVVGLSRFRHLTTCGARWLFQWLLPVPGLRDYTCGYRAYRAGLLQRAFATYGDRLVEEASFACMAEIILKLADLGARCAEVPLVLRYDEKAGESKMNVGRTVRRTLALIARQRRRRRQAKRSEGTEAKR